MKMKLSYREFLAYLRGEAGNHQTLTIGGRNRFSWEIVDNTLRIHLQSGRVRNEALSLVEAFCFRFNERQSFTTTDYPEERNASYMLGLARDYLKPLKH
jgi:hypothetical protein